METHLIPMQPNHLEQVWKIEQQAHSHPWAKSMIDDLSSRGAMHYVLTNNASQVLAYFYAQNIVGEITLLNIAVDPASQGQGLGRQLIESFITLCNESGAESAWLEVRESNKVAFHLYESVGFNEVDRRRDYYPTPQGKEDAVIMSYLFFSF